MASEGELGVYSWGSGVSLGLGVRVQVLRLGLRLQSNVNPQPIYTPQVQKAEKIHIQSRHPELQLP